MLAKASAIVGKINLLDRLVIVLLALFYINIAHQNFKTNDLNKYEQNAIASISKKPSDPRPVDYGAKRALVAIQEQKLEVHESHKGCNCGERVDLYTAGLHQQWCAMFVSWVVNQAGSPLKGTDKTVPWRITNARKIAEYLQQNGTWYSKEDAAKYNIQPQLGDVMVFWRGNFEGNLGHADIVVGVDPNQPNHASLVGGNLFDKVMYRESYYYQEYYGLLGFGRPEKTSGITNSSINIPATTRPKPVPKTTSKTELNQHTPVQGMPTFLLKPTPSN
jgi:hypothetical protein